MITLHVENTVHDFDAWQQVFDTFESFRAGHGVRSYRLSRGVENPHEVAIDLVFDAAEAALGFRDRLEMIWRTPQSQQQLVEHRVPTAYELVTERTLAG